MNSNFFSQKDIGGIDENVFLNELKIANGKNKYYTPDIEDLYVGYEYEMRFRHINEWKKYIFSSTQDLQYLVEIAEGTVGDKGGIRTKYLDKKDIESLGWEVTEAVSPYFGKGTEFLKQIPKEINCMDCFVIRYKLNVEQKNVRIERQAFGGFMGNHESYEQVYYGRCYSINELKTIIKLLNI